MGHEWGLLSISSRYVFLNLTSQNTFPDVVTWHPRRVGRTGEYEQARATYSIKLGSKQIAPPPYTPYVLSHLLLLLSEKKQRLLFYYSYYMYYLRITYYYIALPHASSVLLFLLPPSFYDYLLPSSHFSSPSVCLCYSSIFLSLPPTILLPSPSPLPFFQLLSPLPPSLYFLSSFVPSPPPLLPFPPSLFPFLSPLPFLFPPPFSPFFLISSLPWIHPFPVSASLMHDWPWHTY